MIKPKSFLIRLFVLDDNLIEIIHIIINNHKEINPTNNLTPYGKLKEFKEFAVK